MGNFNQGGQDEKSSRLLRKLQLFVNAVL